MSERDGYEQRPFSIPDGATEVILVRHGSSAPARPGVRFPLVDGRGDPPLSGAGLRQAEAVGERLRLEGVSRLFVTPLRRTHQTADPFAARSGLEKTIVSELIEVGLGEWEGGEYRVRAGRGDPVITRVFAEERWDVIPGGEPLKQLGARVRIGLRRVVEETGPDAIAAAFVHSAVIAELCRQATDSRPFAFINSDNASLSRIVVLPTGRWILRSFNDISHLSPVPAATAG